MTIPPIRLAFGATLWRIFAVATVYLEFVKWHRLERFQALRGTGFRIAALIYLSPRILFRAFVVAAIVTVLLDLYVRLIMRPLFARWYNPRRREEDFSNPLAFRLDAREGILDQLPARLVHGRHAKPGTLVRTDRRVWFTPFGWDDETWSLHSRDLSSVAEIATPSRFGSLVRGIPHRLEFRDCRGIATRFVVADSRVILAWFDEGVRAELSRYEPSAMELH